MSLHFDRGGYDIYESFNNIKGDSYLSVVKFYESNYALIEQLPFLEYLELLSEYLNALFELSRYEKYLQECDELIEISFEHNVYYYRGEDVLESTLLRKAASLFHSYQNKEAKHITNELLHINPENKGAQLLYEKCLLRKNKSYMNHSRAMSIVLFLSSAMVVSIELLLVRPFYDSYVFLVEFLRNLLFTAGLVTIIVSELYNFASVRLRLYKLLRNIKKQKTKKL